ncbi:MAG: hypothetical protein OET63_12605 [Desulfobacterales bacterium]|jgi:hypothetical protein|nr:hypothetical protein [Desulfobacterales bacterium]
MAAGKNRVVICGRIGYVTHRGYNRRFIDGFEKNSMPAINRKIDPACNQCIKDKGKLSAFCLVLTLGVIFLLHAHAAQAKTIEFTFANIFPPTHIQSILNESWAKEVEKRSNGQIKINYYPGGTLLKGPRFMTAS